MVRAADLVAAVWPPGSTLRRPQLQSEVLMGPAGAALDFTLHPSGTAYWCGEFDEFCLTFWTRVRQFLMCGESVHLCAMVWIFLSKPSHKARVGSALLMAQALIGMSWAALRLDQYSGWRE